MKYTGRPKKVATMNINQKRIKISSQARFFIRFHYKMRIRIGVCIKYSI